MVYNTQKNELRTRRMFRERRRESSCKLSWSQIQRLLDPDDTVCYTDGSVLDNPGRGGVGVNIEDPMFTSRWSKPLGSCVTISLAELVAIEMALDFVLTVGTVRDVFILSDSLFAVNSLNNIWKSRKYKNKINQIKSIIRSLNTFTQVHILHIPGHSHIPGNETADSLAKRAALRSPHAVLMPVDYDTIKKAIETRTTRKWQQQWSATETQLSHIMPIVPECRMRHLDQDTRSNVRAVTRLATGHWKSSAYYRWRVLGERWSGCDCGVDEETPHHILFDCPLHKESRERMLCRLEWVPQSLEELLSPWRNNSDYWIVRVFMAEIGKTE